MQTQEVSTQTRAALPHYEVGEFGNANSAANWLNRLSKQGYRLVTMVPVSTTNHFSKETETMVWFVAELDETTAEQR